jgi:hypothetical protein
MLTQRSWLRPLLVPPQWVTGDRADISRLLHLAGTDLPVIEL